jgi:hypothetical protein
MQHVWGRGQVHTEFLWRNVREGDAVGKPRRRWKDNIQMDFRDV